MSILFEKDVRILKECLPVEGYYQHTGTFNVYSLRGVVMPVEFPDTVIADLCFTAYDSENPSVGVTVYKRGDCLFYIPSENISLSENTHVKVLYFHGDTFYLCTENSFHESLVIDGVIKPRFLELFLV